MDTGFKVFGRGCDFELITNGKLASQIAIEAEKLQNPFLKSSIIEVEKSLNDNDSNKRNSNIKNNVGELQQSMKSKKNNSLVFFTTNSVFGNYKISNICFY